MTQTLLEQWISKSSQTRQAATPAAASTIPYEDDDGKTAGREDAEQTRSSTTTLTTKLHPKVKLHAPVKEDIPKFKRLNSLILPIPYPESFYKEIIVDEVANSLTLLAFWNDSKDGSGKGQLIGAIRCRLLKDTASTSPLLYISTLVVLAPYRSLGIASSMLDTLIRRGFEDYGATKVGAHVWEANTAGLEWYVKRGFLETGFEKDYYRKLEPHGAKVMSRTISALDIAKG